MWFSIANVSFQKSEEWGKIAFYPVLIKLYFKMEIFKILKTLIQYKQLKHTELKCINTYIITVHI